MSPPHLYLCHYAEHYDSPLLASYRSLLSETENKRAETFNKIEMKQAFIITRALIRTTLAEKINCQPKDITIAINEWDKPYLSQHPEISFNLSHSFSWAILAVGENCQLGVDIEFTTRKNNIDLVAQRYFSHKEQQWLKAQHNSREAFFFIWTLKEAYIKACGKGLAQPLGSFDFIYNKERSCIEFSTTQIPEYAELQSWHIDYLNEPERPMGLVCLQEKSGDVKKMPEVFLTTPLKETKRIPESEITILS